MFSDYEGSQIEWDDEVMLVDDMFFLLTPLIKTNCSFVKETFSDLYKSVSIN